MKDAMTNEEVEQFLGLLADEVQDVVLNSSLADGIMILAEKVLNRDAQTEADEDPEWYGTVTAITIKVLARAIDQMYFPAPVAR